VTKVTVEARLAGVTDVIWLVTADCH